VEFIARYCNRLKMTKSDKDTLQTPLPVNLDTGGGADLALESLAPDIQELAKKPGRVMCGDIDMRIDASGKWFYQGSIIGRKEMVKLFSTVLHRDDLGQFWLITPAEMARIKVEDAPFTAIEFLTAGAGEDMNIQFRTNVGTFIDLDDEHPLRIEHKGASGEPRPYITVRSGLEALITRASFYQMVNVSSEIETDEGSIVGVWSHGDFFPIGMIADVEIP